MIDFDISPRNSGKTRELIEIYKKHRGIFLVHNINEAKRIKQYGVQANVYRYIQLIDLYWSDEKYIYFDEFFSQDRITYKDIIELDQRGKIMIIRGTPFNTYEPSKEFKEYLKEKYPEYLI